MCFAAVESICLHVPTYFAYPEDSIITCMLRKVFSAVFFMWLKCWKLLSEVEMAIARMVTAKINVLDVHVNSIKSAIDWNQTSTPNLFELTQLHTNFNALDICMDAINRIITILFNFWYILLVIFAHREFEPSIFLGISIAILIFYVKQIVIISNRCVLIVKVRRWVLWLVK